MARGSGADARAATAPVLRLKLFEQWVATAH